jgi:RimJ/RimL family protein N-acetyltransferase
MILETERLTLREMTIQDLPALNAIVCDDETTYAFEGAWSEEESKAGLQKQIDHYKKYGYGRWAAVLKSTGEVIGICGIQWCNAGENDVPEIGYLFNRRFWRKGYAVEAAIACKRYGFEHLGFGELYSTIRDTNIASLNVAFRSGMTIRGQFARHHRGLDMPHYILSVKKGEDVRYNQFELSEARRALMSTLHKCEKMDLEKLGKSQRTLLERRIAAFRIALALIEKEQGGTQK